MSIQNYLKGCQRGEFVWECVESGTYGEGNSVDIENTNLKGRFASIRRCSSDCFEAEVDNLENNPVYDEREFTSRKSARNWCERLIRNDVNKSV